MLQSSEEILDTIQSLGDELKGLDCMKDNLKNAMEEVESSAADSDNMVTTISGAAKEQKATANEIIKAMDDMKQSVDDLVNLLRKSE